MIDLLSVHFSPFQIFQMDVEDFEDFEEECLSEDEGQQESSLEIISHKNDYEMAGEGVLEEPDQISISCHSHLLRDEVHHSLNEVLNEVQLGYKLSDFQLLSMFLAVERTSCLSAQLVVEKPMSSTWALNCFANCSRSLKELLSSQSL